MDQKIIDQEIDIGSNDFKERFEIVWTNDLSQTEEIVSEDKLEVLINTLTNKEASITPLFVLRDANSNMIVLDGNHRYLALKKMGIQVTPVFFIKKNEFEIEAWDQCIEIRNSDNVNKVISELGLFPVEKPLIENPNLHQAILNFNGNRYACQTSPNKLNQHRKVKEIITRLFELGEITENTTRTKNEAVDLIPVPGWLVIQLPVFSKDELEKIIQKGEILPPKSYRIVFPTGPIRLPVKVEFLRSIPAQIKQSKTGRLGKTDRTNLQSFVNQRKQKEFRQIDIISLPQEVDISKSDKYRALIKLLPVIKNFNYDFTLLNKSDLLKLHPCNLRAKVVRVIDFKKNTSSREAKKSSTEQAESSSIDIKIQGHYRRKTIFLHDFSKEIFNFSYWKNFFEVLEGRNVEPFLLIIEGPAVIDFNEIHRIYQKMISLFRDQGLVYIELSAYIKQTVWEVRKAIPDNYLKTYQINK